MLSFQNVINQLKIDEGFRSEIYLCSEGKQTFGYGWNVDDNGITKEQAEMILKDQVNICHRELVDNFDWYITLPGKMQEVLINMCFNMGISRLKGFKKALKAFENREYLTAAAEMKDSRWYDQVGVRAQRLVKIVSNGQLS